MIEKLKRFLIKLSNEYCGPNAIDGGLSDLLIVAVSIIVVFLSFYFCLKFLIWPGEKDQGHIKRVILSERNER